MSDKHDPPPDYPSLEIIQWEQAKDEVKAEAEAKSSRILKVVRSFATKFGYQEQEVLIKIIDDDMFAAHFAKDPLRTGLHEREAARWIESLPWVFEFERLPSGKPRGLKVSSDGNIETEVGNRKLPGKTLDFRWRTGGKTFYAMHKYIKESGGHQDNQHNEMKELLTRFYRCQADNIVLVVIADGNYYKEHDRRRLKELRQHERQTPPQIHVLPIEELDDLLREYNLKSKT